MEYIGVGICICIYISIYIYEYMYIFIWKTHKTLACALAVKVVRAISCRQLVEGATVEMYA